MPNNPKSKSFNLGTYNPSIKTPLKTVAIYFAMKDYVEKYHLNPKSFEVSETQIDDIVREWLRTPESLGILRENAPFLIPDEFSAELLKVEKEYEPKSVAEGEPLISQVGTPKFMSELDEIISRVRSGQAMDAGTSTVHQHSSSDESGPQVHQYPIPSPFGPDHTEVMNHLIQFHQIEVEMCAKVLFAMLSGSDQAVANPQMAQKFRVLAAAVLSYGLVVQEHLPPGAQCTAPENGSDLA